MNDIVVLCDAPSHGKTVRAGVLSREARPQRELFLKHFGVEPDPARHRERHKFRCTRCGDAVTIGRPETLAKVRARLVGVDVVTIGVLRGILVDK